MPTTRREILGALLGASAAAAACRDDGAPDAAFVDPALRRGHRLRDDPKRAGEASTRSRAARVLILGGGVSGLSAAWALRRRGVRDVVVLELEPVAGGTALGATTPLVGYPWGAHYLPAPGPEQPELVALLEEMGVVTGRDAEGAPVFAEGARVATPEERIFADGIWRPGLAPELARGGAAARARFGARMQAFAAARGVDGRPAFRLPSTESSEDPRFAELDGLDFRTWLDGQGFSHPDVRWLTDYATRDDFGARPESTSAWFGVHYHAARLDPRTGRSRPFLTWPEGNFRLVRHLAGGLRVETGRLVLRARPAEGGVEVLAEGPDGALERWRAPRAIIALPSFIRRRVLVGLRREEPDIETSAWLVANLHLRHRPGSAGFETAWDNVLRDSRALGYVVSTHQLGPRAGPTVWTWYLPLVDLAPREARRHLLALDAREAAALALADLAPAHRGLDRAVERVELRRWGHAMPIPRPGLRGALAAARRPEAGFHFAHTDLSGVGLFEEAFHHGLRAAKEVAGALGGPG